MLVRLSDTDTGYIEFVNGDEIYFDGRQLQGAKLFTARLKDVIIQFQELSQLNFSFSYRFFDFLAPKSLRFQEKNQGLRLEAVLTGNVGFLNNANKLFPGQYQFSNAREYSLLFQGHSATSIFVTYFSEDLIQSAKISDLIKTNAVYQLEPEMSALLRNIIVHDYNQQVRNFFYETCIRELLLYHLKHNGSELPDQFDKKLIPVILSTDAFIKEDLSKHYTIDELARRSGTNAFTLKKGYRQYFKMGLFERLSNHRFQRAKEQLQENIMSIEEISMAAGYQHVASFIKAFKKRFGITPLEWRKNNLK